MTTLENKWIQKLIADLATEGIMFYEDPEEIDIVDCENKILGHRKLQNVIFEKNGKKVKIYNGVFFREDGLSCIPEKVKAKGEKNDLYQATPVSDEFFYEMEKSMIRYSLIGIYE
jgi:hypothetical protein